jgi:lipopolysaccharide biosynthesis glycosyltransferase
MRKIHILLGADDAYAMPLTVAAHSALYHLDRNVSPEVHIVDGGISKENRDRIKACLSAAHPQAVIAWRNPGFEQFSEVNVRHYSKASMSRLLMPSLFPATVERVLYLDSDIVVEDDVSVLWSIPLGQQAVWAVQDAGDDDFDKGLRKKFPDLDAAPGARYFNSGVLLVNLPHWRAQNITERVIQFLKAHSDRLSYPDQDALNAVICGDWGRLPPRWNKQIIRIGCPESAALDDSGILHYSTYKPWEAAYTWKARIPFHKAFLRSGWKPGPRSWLAVAVLLARQLVNSQLVRIRRVLDSRRS